MTKRTTASPIDDLDLRLKRCPPGPLLYKFRSTRDDYHWAGLKKGCLWISGAMDLNDPFDSKPKSLLRRGTEKERQIFRKKVQKVGVLSFSGPLKGGDKEILQWSHYADVHRGYCLMIRNPDLWRKTKLVTYPLEYPEFAEDVAASPDFWEKEGVGFFKARCWQYENERRALLPGEGKTEYVLPKGTIWGVIFGCWSRPHEQRRVARYAQRHSPRCYFFQAEILPDEFGLRYSETTIEYRRLSAAPQGPSKQSGLPAGSPARHGRAARLS